MAPLKLSQGKIKGIQAVADRNGVIAALAMDQRGSLQKSIGKAKGGEASAEELAEFKQIVSEVLTPYASAILLDPEFGSKAVQARDPKAGVLLAYEKTGYDAAVKGRLPDLIPECSVRRLIADGANAIKFLLYYDPDDAPHVLDLKHAFMERVGAECRANDVPLFLEIVCYSDAIPDEKSIEFARVKPGKVLRSMQEFAAPQYGVDVFKVEAPVNMRFVKGSSVNTDGQVAYTREEAKQHFAAAATAAQQPFIYLSAGVSNALFRETLELAGEAGTPFSGVLCGRATWQDGIQEYGKGGATALRGWLKDKGVQNIQDVNRTLVKVAKPWWDNYGGKASLGIE